MPFIPSHYQQAIFDFAERGEGNALVSAVAGAGKSTTLLQCAQRVQGGALFVAFNKHIADHLGKRLGGRNRAATLHKIGLETLKQRIPKPAPVEVFKYGEIAKRIIEAYEPNPKLRFVAWPRVLRGAEFARLTLAELTSEGLNKMADDYGLNLWESDHTIIKLVLEEGERQALKESVIDFTDMLWLCERWELYPYMWNWLLVDELQDLNACQRALALKLSRGRIIGVGDLRQSIMAWAGADIRSWEAFKTATNAQELPLSICYRCPSSHLDLAREIVPEIEARPDAPCGILEEASIGHALSNAAQDDLFLCRRTAPLIRGCLYLIARGIKARVRGREIGAKLAEAAKEIALGCEWANFRDGVVAWWRECHAELEEHNASEKRKGELLDIAQGLLAAHDRIGKECSSIDDLAKKIKAIFADENAAVWFSSIHRAKGLEAHRVIVMEFDKLGEGYGFQSKTEREQEMNLKYVALTRSMHTLILCLKED